MLPEKGPKLKPEQQADKFYKMSFFALVVRGS
jgi:hypothetical protein